MWQVTKLSEWADAKDTVASFKNRADTSMKHVSCPLIEDKTFLKTQLTRKLLTNTSWHITIL